MTATPLLGWIPPEQRTQAQQDAHRRALARRVAFALAFTTPPKGTKVILTQLWKDPIIVQDIGKEFTGFHQLTGSCVGASAGNAVATLSMVQRWLAQSPTQALVPWWPFAYGRTRTNEGDRGQGEGAVDSVMGATLHSEGTFDYREQGLPTFDTSDGWALSEHLEMQWSDGAASVVTAWAPKARPNIVGGVATLSSTDEIAAAILNGYPVLDGCSSYMAHGSVKGDGADAYVLGHYDGQGGHSTCFLGYWVHPNDGELFLYSNQWPASTYPPDPAGGGRCCCWMTRAGVDRLWRLGGGEGETMALSHLAYLPAQPQVLDWFI